MALGTVIRSFAAPSTVPRGIAWDGQYLWVADQGGVDAVYQHDPVTGTIIRSFATPAINPSGLAYDGRYLWLVVASNTTTYQIDPSTGTVVRSFSSIGASPQGITWDGHYLWQVNLTARTIHQVDPATGTSIRSFSSPSISPAGLCWDGRYLWHTDFNTDLIYQIDPVSGVVLRSAASPSTSPYGIDFDGRTLWHSDFQSDTIYQLAVTSEAQYAQKVLSYGPIVYFPQWEDGGTISADISGNARHGTYQGVDLGWAGIGDGATCPYFDGVNDYNNILTAGLAAAFNGDEGSLMLWWQHDAGAHNDSTLRRMVRLHVDANNYILVAKTGTNGNVQMDYNAGGTAELGGITVAAHRPYFSHLAMTWSKSNDRVRYYDQGGAPSSDATLGVWAGVPAVAMVGATDTTPTNPYFGWLAHVALFDYELASADVTDLATVP